VFCLQRCLDPKNKTELNRFFKTLQADQRVTCLSPAARDELKRSIQEVINARGSRDEGLLPALSVSKMSLSPRIHTIVFSIKRQTPVIIELDP
jgi:polysaccharide pyruvyl transferase WcaK-like protein